MHGYRFKQVFFNSPYIRLHHTKLKLLKNQFLKIFSMDTPPQFPELINKTER